MRVLLVEDDPVTSCSIELQLTHANFNVYCTGEGHEAIELARLYDYDLIILDLNLPDVSGVEVLRTIRQAEVSTPVLILTGSDDMETRLKCLDCGADDYMTKPYHRAELVARMRAIIRRSKGHASSVIRTGAISVNLATKVVTVAGKAVHFTGKEYQTLELLLLRRGSTVTIEMFLNHLYGGMDEPDAKVIPVVITRMRKKFREVCGEGYITNVRGRGYTLQNPEENEAAE